MFYSCAYCGRVHDEKIVCKQKNYKNDSEANKFRNTKAWQDKRIEIKKRDKFLCQVCVRDMHEPKYKYNYENLEVHHLIPIKVAKNLSLVNENLITLCNRHHAMIERWRDKIFRNRKNNQRARSQMKVSPGLFFFKKFFEIIHRLALLFLLT